MEDTKSLYDKVRSEIKYNIINGIYPMGKRLKAKKLADELYVSRTPVNKALSSLYEEGLLSYNKNVGYSVRIITIEDIEEIFKIRTALDALSFKEASLKMDEDDFDYVKNFIDKAELAFNDNDVDKLRQASKEFNESIYDFSDMPRLKMIISELYDYLEVLRKLSFNTNNIENKNKRMKQAVEEHRKILNLMENKDYEKLGDFIRKHLKGSKENILGESYRYRDYILDEKEEKPDEL